MRFWVIRENEDETEGSSSIKLTLPEALANIVDAIVSGMIVKAGAMQDPQKETE